MIVNKQFSGPGTLPFNVEIYTPDNTTGLLPAHIFFTGRGESGMNAGLIDVNGPTYFIKNKGWKPNFIVVGVQVNQNQAPAPVALVQCAIDTLLKDPAYRVDPNKWYLTGLSYGAATVVGYIKTQIDSLFRKPAAVVIMSINMDPALGSRYDATYTLGISTNPDTKVTSNDLRFKNIPAWGFCGTSDSFYETMNKYWMAMQKLGYTAPWTTANEGHGPWNQWYDPAYKDPKLGLSIYDWALQFSNSEVVTPPVVTPPVVTPPAPKTIKSITITYSDGSVQTLP